MRVEFRDGARNVPDYLGDLMRGIETIKLTYDQAVHEANQSLVRRELDREQSKVINEHFSKWRTR